MVKRLHLRFHGVGEKIGRLTISCQIGIKTYPGGQSSHLSDSYSQNVVVNDWVHQ